MATTPVKVVVDCGGAIGLAASVPGLLEQAVQAARVGDAETTAELLALARERSEADESAAPMIQIVELDETEIAQQATDRAEHEVRQEEDKARQWVSLRMKRDRWLSQTDAFFVSPLPSDFPADKTKAIEANLDAWRSFRQQLRDLPANTDDPFNPEWPEHPAAPVLYLT